MNRPRAAPRGSFGATPTALAQAHRNRARGGWGAPARPEHGLQAAGLALLDLGPPPSALARVDDDLLDCYTYGLAASLGNGDWH